MEFEARNEWEAGNFFSSGLKCFISSLPDLKKNNSKVNIIEMGRHEIDKISV